MRNIDERTAGTNRRPPIASISPGPSSPSATPSLPFRVRSHSIVLYRLETRKSARDKRALAHVCVHSRAALRIRTLLSSLSLSLFPFTLPRADPLARGMAAPLSIPALRLSFRLYVYVYGYDRAVAFPDLSYPSSLRCVPYFSASPPAATMMRSLPFPKITSIVSED